MKEYVFPTVEGGGMTLRQFYAAMALQVIMEKSTMSINWGTDGALAEMYSREAFRWADAMIKVGEEVK